MSRSNLGRRALIYVVVGFILMSMTGCQQTNTQVQTVLLEDGAIYKITSSLSNRVMESSYFGMMEGNYVQSMDWEGDLNQVWKAQRQADGTWAFQNMSTLRYLTVRRASTSKGTQLCVEQREEGNAAQTFVVESAQTGYDEYRIRSSVSGLYLELKDNQKGVGTQIVQNEISDQTGQFWYIDKVDDGKTKLPYTWTQEGESQFAGCIEATKYNDSYYAYFMADGIGIKRSDDLVQWEYIGSVMPKPTGTSTQLSYAWQEEAVPGGNFVAPGAYKIGEQYCLYYAVTTEGSQKSFIGLLTNTTLDPSQADYLWEDKGIVLSSYVGDPYNCIDPNVFVDVDGQPWLVWGSWWEGIFMRKLDPSTGYLDETDTQLHHLASYAPGDKGVEAPYLIYRDGWYYLFVAHGNYNAGDYVFKVARSKSLLGPYENKEGKTAMDGYYTEVTSSQQGIINPGHASVLLDDDGTYYLVSGYRTENGSNDTFVGTLEWDENGWPYSALVNGVFR